MLSKSLTSSSTARFFAPGVLAEVYPELSVTGVNPAGAGMVDVEVSVSVLVSVAVSVI